MKKFLSVLESKGDILSVNDKRNIHYKSLQNFLLHFSELPNGHEKEMVESLIIEYFGILDQNQFLITREEGRIYLRRYIAKIGQFYSYFLNFKIIPAKDVVMFLGIIADLVLLITGVLKYVLFIPISTLSFLGFYFYRLSVFGKENKLYGSGY